MPWSTLHSIYGPARYKSNDWDLLLITLSYENQILDISGAYTTKIRDAQTNTPGYKYQPIFQR
jgi:hypothetical protein